jgi:capsid protein
MQTAKDSDWLVGQELTAAAIAAGLTLLIRETNDGGDLDFDTENFGGWANGEEYGLQHVSDVGLAAGTAARVGPGESVEVIESERPNRNVEPFVKYLTNLAAMSGNVSFHRFTGDPTGASFATLRAMMIQPLVAFPQPQTTASAAGSSPVTSTIRMIVFPFGMSISDGEVQ